MKKFTKISLILAAILGGTGIILCGVATAFGAHMDGGTMQAALEKAGLYDEKDGFHIGFTNDGFWHAAKGEEASEEAFAAEKIKNLEIKCDMADLTLEKGTDDGEVFVSMEDGYKKYFTCKLEGDTLHVEYVTKSASFSDGPNITVRIPDGMALDAADMECDIGNITVEADALQCDTLTLACDMGNIDISGAIVKNYLDMECDMGNCTFDGTVKGDIAAETDMGNINLTLAAAYEDYDYSISCDMGSVEINGEDYGEGDKKVNIENTGAFGKMELSSSMGSITVEFK
jgi:hypothetical protein